MVCIEHFYGNYGMQGPLAHSDYQQGESRFLPRSAPAVTVKEQFTRNAPTVTPSVAKHGRPRTPAVPTSEELVE